jgi:hypothetical protein
MKGTTMGLTAKMERLLPDVTEVLRRFSVPVVAVNGMAVLPLHEGVANPQGSYTMTFREKFLMFFGLVAILLVIQQITVHPVLLVPLAAVAAGLYYLIQQRRVARQQPPQTTTDSTLMDRVNRLGTASATASAAAFDPNNKASVGKFITEMADYNLNLIDVATSEETTDAPHFKVAARLEPLVPIPDGHMLRSWIGGNPRLPDPFVWPERGGVPYYFLAQVDCSELPEDLWGGRGPRTGWLAFFCSGEGKIASKAVHTATLGPERQAPAGQAGWLYHDHDAKRCGLDNMFNASPEWPVRVMGMEAKPESRPSSDENPTYRKEIDLTLPEYQPHSWATAQVLLVAARHHVSEVLATVRNARTKRQVALAAGNGLAQQTSDEAKDLLQKLTQNRSTFTAADWAPVAQAAKQWRRMELEQALKGPAVFTGLFYGLGHSSWPMRNHLEKTGRKDSREHAQLSAINASSTETSKALGGGRRIGIADDLSAWADFKAENPEEWQRLAQKLREDFAVVDSICSAQPGPLPIDQHSTSWGSLQAPFSWPQSADEAEKLLQFVINRCNYSITQQNKLAAEAPEQVMRNDTQIEGAERALSKLDDIIGNVKSDALTNAFGPRRWHTVFAELSRVNLTSHDGAALPLLNTGRWKQSYVNFRAKLAAGDYSKSPSSLPAAQRDFLETHWGWSAQRETAKLGGMPEGWSYEVYENTKTVAVLFEAPSCDLMGWHFGDVNSFVATIGLDALAKGDFSSTGADITN